MSIYEGTIGEQEYANGRDDGRAAADYLAEEGWPSYASVREGDGWEYARTARSERTRAYWLGWLRGFRQASR